ncbi:LLM class flavin-dependent oxidoreductase [Mycobacterium sp. 21AC1]|uniref:LLM class flavin-dependent oxidoreductase n=1 Tax=[Mycobacterium] appelbergii TaxID=2939269 RepID=UPI0029393D16|nr:LLM class flavin-dependent oxidoreductase [Mycobacterium sp. 21AC1]MDV3128391.1 LLM class flavin-dependent oxidoreductase [Mycobacterium sp. 21AC1]
MSIGVFFHGWATPDRSDADVLDEILESTECADLLGFDIAWYTEQHTRSFGNIWGRVAAPQLLIANASARTSAIGLGSAVRLAVDVDASTLVEEMLTLDALSRGRAQFGFGAGMPGTGQGHSARELRREALRARVEEVADILEDGQRGTKGSMGMQNRDLTDRIHLASIDEQTIEMAARRGFGYFAGLFGGARQARLARSFRAAGGRGPVRAVRMVFVGADDTNARDLAEPAVMYFWSNFTPPSPEWRRAVEKAGTMTYEQIIAELGWIVGGAEKVAEELHGYMTESSLDGLDVAFHAPGLDSASADRSMERFARHVLPAIRPSTALSCA